MPGPRGYPDWQRQVNYDSPLFLSTVNQAVPPTLTSGTQDVSQFAYLAGQFGCTGNTCDMEIRWWADSALVMQVGAMGFSLSQNIASAGQFRIPHLGPFMTLSIGSIGGIAATVTARAFSTNRVHPLNEPPTPSQLIAVPSTNLNASTAVNVYPNGYYAGPVRVYVDLPAANWFVTLFSYSTTGTTPIIDKFTSTAAVATGFTTVVPMGAWFAQVFNATGVAGNYILSATPSTSGAA